MARTASYPVRAFTFFSLSLWLCMGQNAQAGMWVSEEAPAEFQQLETPHLSVVNVVYGGNLLGAFPAHVTPSSLKFDAPDALIAQIPAIKDKTKLSGILGNFMPLHADLLCGRFHAEGCGVLPAELTGIIFDENGQNAELFISKNELSVTNDDAVRYLPTPPQKFSSVYAFSGAAAGVQSQSSSYSLTNNSIFAYGERKLSTQSTVSNAGLRFDTVAASMERNGMEAQGGLFRSRALQLVGDTDMAGVTVSSSTHTVLDTHKNEGNDIIVYLPRRSFVSLYRDGRLYSSRAYEAGNQHIDTSDLPEGAYVVTLRIQEPDGAIREEKRFFAKSQQLPPPNFPTYYAEAGVLRKPASMDSALPDITGSPIVGAGMVRRIGENLGLNVDVIGVEDRAAIESGIFMMHEGTDMRATVLASTQGDVGLQASFLHNTGKFSTSLDVRKVWSTTSVGTVNANDNELFSGLTQGTATMSYAFNPQVTVGVRASYSQPEGEITTTSVGPYASWHIWQHGESTLDLTADAARIANQNEGSVLVHFSYKLGKYGVTGGTGVGYGTGAAGVTGNVRGWEDEITPDHELIAGAGVSADKNAQIVSADGDWHNHIGRIHGNIQESMGSAGAALGYGGNFSINAAQLENEVHVGGDESNRSAVIIETKGDNNAAMKVFVNNALTTTVKVGSSQVLYLSPYHSYNIRLAPGEDKLLDYDTAEHNITLYPGNVTRMHWDVNTFYIIAGKIVTADNKPLANAVLQESHVQTTTDNAGNLQAELSRPVTLNFTLQDNSTCQVQLPRNITPINGVIVYAKALTCTATAKIASR